MPFKSEKQRRFLWAEHPEIAKRWAHEYPKSNKNLPMYAPKETPESDADTKAAHAAISRLISQNPPKRKVGDINYPDTSISKTDKTADSKQEVIDVPHSSKPVYAGEEREKGQISSAIPESKNIGGTCEQKPKNAINELLTKLSVVLSPRIEQTVENMRAEREGRVARRIPRNRNIKQYPVGGINIMPPMGMAQNQPQPAQPQQNNQYPGRPVGGGSNPQFNPINSFGAISMSGVINGNAAFGAKNSPDSSKLSCVIKRANEPIDFDQWHGKAFKIVSTPEGKAVKSHTDGTPVANEPGQVSIVTPENGDAWNWPDAPAETVNNFKKNWGSIQGGIAGYKMDQIRRGMQKQPTAPQPPAPSVPQPPKPPVPAPNTGAMTSQPIPIKQASRSEILGKIMSMDAVDPTDVDYYNEEYEEELAGRKAAASTTLQADPLATYEAEMARQHGSPAHNLWLELSGMFDDDAESGKHDYNDPQARTALIAKHKQLMADEQAHKTFLNERATFHANADNKLQALLKGAAADALEHDLPAEKKPTQGPSLLTTGLVGAGAGLGAFGLSKALEASGYSPGKLVQPYLPAAPEWLKNLGTKLEEYMTPKSAKDNKTRANTPCFSAAVEEKQGAWPAVLGLAALEAALSAGSYAWGRHDGWTAAQPTTAQKVTPYVLGGLAGTGLGVLGYHAMDKFKKKKPPQPVQEPKLYSPEEPEMAQKYSADKKCSCGCGDTVNTCKCSSSCSCKKPGGSCYKPTEKESAMKNYTAEDVIKIARCWAGYEPVPGKAPYSEDSCRPVGSGKKKKKKEESKSEKKAGTPAWQRSEGKNDEGGLNEKGRKSYEREHGGNLKAPVTQKNPKGEAKKRQNSFCSRMCGMKRVNTGSKTKNDPDSRINKSLRKWNCKCSSAMAFGALAGAETEKQANPLALAARVAKPGWAAVQAALRAGKATATGAKPGLIGGWLARGAGAADDVAGAAQRLLPAIGSKAEQAIKGVVQNLYSHPAAKYVADHTGKGFRALHDTVSGMANMGDDAIAKVIGPRFRELQTNAISAQRMAAGHLKVPRPKPVGFSDVNPQDWKALTDSWDAQDAIRRTLGM